MKKIFTLLCMLISAFVHAQLIVEWNFNSRPLDTNFSTGTTTPNIGAGLIGPVGSVSCQYNDANGSSDPTPSDNTGYLINNFPIAGQGDKSAGIEFSADASNFSNIILKFNIKCASNAANKYTVQYCTDGITFIDFGSIRIRPDNADVYIRDNIFYLSAVSGLNYNSNIKFRIVASFDDNENTYVAVNRSVTDYSTAGEVSFDMISLTSFFTLPVSIASFTGAYTNKTSLLKWSVNSEINISKYVVEHSADGRIFSEIGAVNATGHTDYAYTDATAKSGINFYRLKIVGAGATKFTAVIKIISGTFNSKLNVYPSPAVNDVNAEFVSENKNTATVQITDVSGRRIMQKNMSVEQGYNNIILDVNSFRKGMYIIKINLNGHLLTSSFNKL